MYNNNKNINKNNIDSNPVDTISNNNEIIDSNSKDSKDSKDPINDKDVNIDAKDSGSIALDLDHISYKYCESCNEYSDNDNR